MILAHDLGTTGIKSVVVDAERKLVAAVSISYATVFRSQGWAEQDPEDWWRAVCLATGQLTSALPNRGREISAVCFSGQMMGATFVNTNREVLRPSMIWADRRASAQTKFLIGEFGLLEGYEITGHRFDPTYSLSKIMWVRDNEPDVFRKTSKVLQAKDYIVLRLTGIFATDFSDASSTNAFDQSRKGWSEEILAVAGISSKKFPDALESTTIAGTVTEAAAGETGLLAGTPVVMGGGDGPMAAVGAGILDASCGAYAYLGSSSWVSIATDAPLRDSKMRTMTFNHVLPNRFVPTATMQAGGASFDWALDVLEGIAEASFSVEDTLPQVEASKEGLFFLPHLLGERSPYWDPAARGAFIGLMRHHNSSNMLRAVIEGIAFNLLTCLRAFCENDVEIDSVEIIGGLANSAAISQILADVWGFSVAARPRVSEATSVGAALIGGLAVGLFNEDLLRLEKPGSPGFDGQLIEPDPTVDYHDAHRFFLDAYSRLEVWFRNTSSLRLD